MYIYIYIYTYKERERDVCQKTVVFEKWHIQKETKTTLALQTKLATDAVAAQPLPQL